VLLPITMFCFAIMARHSAKTLSLHFFALNMLLLLPIRSSFAAGTVALLGTIYALYFVKEAAAKDRALKTTEGRFALTTLFIPAGIILFRSMYFYQVDSLMVAMLSMAAFLAARQASIFPDRDARVALLLDALSVPIALTFACAVTGALVPDLTWTLTAPVFSIAYTALALDLMRRDVSRVLSATIGASICLLVPASFMLGVAIEQSALMSVIGLVAGGLFLMSGMALRHRTASIAGIGMIAASLFFGVEALLTLVLASSWVDLAIFGACAITLGSVLDRHGVAINVYLARRFGRISQQNEEISLGD